MYNGKTHDKSNIKEYTGYMILDYDKLSKQEISDMKNILKQNQYVVLIFDSPSGNGIKVLVKINQLQRIKHDDHYHEDYFNFIKDYFSYIVAANTKHQIKLFMPQKKIQATQNFFPAYYRAFFI